MGEDLRRRFKKVKSFRDDVVHGNSTESKGDNFYCILEDGLPFCFSPRSEATPYFMASEQVKNIQNTVDDVIGLIVEGMEPSTRKWVRSWLHEPFIPARTWPLPTPEVA
jgi:hypothetical protein